MTTNLEGVGLLLVVSGFILIFLAALLLALGSIRGAGGKVRGAAVVFIGPVPLAIATDKLTLLVAAVLAVGMILVLYLYLVNAGGLPSVVVR